MATLGIDSYTTEAAYTAYAATRGITVGTNIEFDLVLSADFITQYYNLADEYKLPTIEVAELALIANAALKAVELQQAGRLSIDFATLSKGVIKREMKKADVLEKEIEYQDNTTPTYKPRVPELDALMRPFVAYGNLVKRLA
jgi:hypothetical protein